MKRSFIPIIIATFLLFTGFQTKAGNAIKIINKTKFQLANPVITISPVTGGILACAGNYSLVPNVEQFTVKGSNLTTDIIATAPAGFEVSLLPDSGYSTQITIPQTAGTVNSTIVYTRSTPLAPVGNITGNVVITSSAITQNITVDGVVRLLPFINPVANQIVANGSATAAINFTGTYDALIWMNDTPGIGLAANGGGNIASFIAINNGTTPIIATITATPINIVSYAYITNSGSNTVSVINTTLNKVVATIPVGATPTGTTVAGNVVYIANSGANTVSAINATTNKVIATIPVGIYPYGLVTSPDGTKVYVANEKDGTLSVISTATNTVIATIKVGPNVLDVTSSSDGSVLYVSDNLHNTVYAVSTATNSVIATITLPSEPYGLLLSPNGGQLYVGSSNSPNVYVINTLTNTLTTTIPTGANPQSLTLNGNFLYTVNTIDNNVSVINLKNNTSTTIPVGINPQSANISPDGKYLYVPNAGSGNVSVISLATQTVIATVPTGANPASIGAFFTSNELCSGTPITFTITVNPTLYPIVIPNTFTPNGDGINDNWDIQFINEYPKAIVQIYNRYGTRLLYYTGYLKPWDGRYKGSDVPAGTYYYVINLNNGSKPIGGYVAVIR